MKQIDMSKFKEFNIIETVVFPISKITIGEWVLLKCRFGCDSYNTNWCCHPATFPVEQFKRMLSEYSKAILVVGKGDGLRNQNRFIEGLTALERECFLQGYYKAFALTNGPCMRCRKCTYPQNPCKHPDKARPTCESMGIDVFQTVKNLKREIKVLKKGDSFYCYGIILLK